MPKMMCPVCDLPVKAMNYCPRCKKIIRHPYIQKVDYYLNEGHPMFETNCDYHNPVSEVDYRED